MLHHRYAFVMKAIEVIIFNFQLFLLIDFFKKGTFCQDTSNDKNGLKQIKAKIITGVNCPDNCNFHGFCRKGKCICNAGLIAFQSHYDFMYFLLKRLHWKKL